MDAVAEAELVPEPLQDAEQLAVPGDDPVQGGEALGQAPGRVDQRGVVLVRDQGAEQK